MAWRTFAAQNIGNKASYRQTIDSQRVAGAFPAGHGSHAASDSPERCDGARSACRAARFCRSSSLSPIWPRRLARSQLTLSWCSFSSLSNVKLHAVEEEFHFFRLGHFQVRELVLGKGTRRYRAKGFSLYFGNPAAPSPGIAPKWAVRRWASGSSPTVKFVGAAVTQHQNAVVGSRPKSSDTIL